jgi:hypothetical protein
MTLSKVNKQWEENGVLRTPSKTKKQPQRVIKTFDDFDRDTVRKIITKSYEENRIITLPDLRTEFLRVKEDSRQEAIRLKLLHPSLPDPPTEKFSCCQETFNKYVHLLGYKYGKIDTRKAIIQRPDIVKWRGSYIRRIRENDAAPVPKKLVYLGNVFNKINPVLKNLMNFFFSLTFNCR